mgnify:CR=1 FL=1
MALKTFNLPDPGEGLVEAEVTEWRVAVGDTVTVNQIVLEVETAKSLVELPIPWAGTVVALLVEVGQTVPVGSPIVTIDDGQGEPAPASAGAAGAVTAQVTDGLPAASGSGAEPDPARQATLVGYGAKEGSSSRRARKAIPRGGARPVRALVQSSFDPEQMSIDPEHPGHQAMWTRADEAERTMPPIIEAPSGSPDRGADAVDSGAAQGDRVKAKPPVRKYARDLGVDLAAVTGSGPDGTITRDDVTAYAQSQRSTAAPGQTPVGTVAPPPPTAGPASVSPASVSPASAGPSSASPGSVAAADGRRETRIPVKGIRKMMATAMVSSAFTAPHVTEWVTVDVTRTMELVDRLKADREFRNVRVTPLLILARAMCMAIQRHPEINATWDEAAQEIVVKHYVNLGIAAATPRGLIVPNIKNADQMSMIELADAIGSLVHTARAGRTQPADMAGGTITITNVGVFGVDLGTPIINPGESAILAFGAVRRQPWVVTSPSGEETIEPRSVALLALSFDHRLIDGELGSRFLADVAAIMHDPARGFVWG